MTDTPTVDPIAAFEARIVALEGKVNAPGTVTKVEDEFTTRVKAVIAEVEKAPGAVEKAVGRVVAKAPHVITAAMAAAGLALHFVHF